MPLHRSNRQTPSAAADARGNVRVLRDESELALATARAEEGARRLRDRLDARAAHDAATRSWAAERIGWHELMGGDRAGPVRRFGVDAGQERPPPS